jgi:PAS domain-containing protein
VSARPAVLTRLSPPAGDVIAWLDAVTEPLLVLEEGTSGLQLVHVNEALCQAVRLDRETLLARGLSAWLGEEARGRLVRAAQSAFMGGRARCRDLDGSGAIAELRRIRGRDRVYCLGTLRLPAGTSAVPGRTGASRRADEDGDGPGGHGGVVLAAAFGRTVP